MQMHELSIHSLREAPWNPNSMDEPTLAKLRTSIQRFGLVSPLVVRSIGDAYEVLSGNQRLVVLRDLNCERVPCVVVEMGDADARLLAQTINRLHGADDLGLEAGLVRSVIEELGEGAVLSVLPHSAAGLREIASLGVEGMADYLSGWQQKQGTRLRHFTARMSSDQQEMVERVLASFMDSSESDKHPNRRGNALFRLCQTYLELRGDV